jgi:hypothetical protein
MRMRMKLGAGAAVAALGAGALGASGVLAGESSDGPGQVAGATSLRLDTERVAGPSSGSASAAGLDQTAGRQRANQVRLTFRETDPLTLDPGRVGTTVGPCPVRSKVINGYYFVAGTFTGFGLDNQGDSPRGLRRWAFYLENENPAPVTNVTFGIICAKGVK